MSILCNDILGMIGEHVERKQEQLNRSIHKEKFQGIIEFLDNITMCMEEDEVEVNDAVSTFLDWRGYNATGEFLYGYNK